MPPSKPKSPSTPTATAATGSISGIAYRPAPGKFVDGYGPLPAPIMLIGERPGETEAEQGRPFCGKSGQILDDWLDRAGLDRACCRATNVCRDFKYGNPEPLAWEIERDLPKLYAEIAECQPTVIAAIGAYAIRTLLGPGHDLDKVHGVPRTVNFDSWGWGEYECVVVPVYHPANTFYQVDLAAKGQVDVMTLARVIRGQQSPVVDNIQTHYDELDDDTYQAGGLSAPTVGIDTEGWKRRPWCISFSQEAGYSSVIRSTSRRALEQFKYELAAYVADGGIILLHNAMHDLGVLRDMGIELPPRSFIDTMVVAYLLRLEPQGLKPLSWRHSGMEMSSYEELVGEANKLHAFNYVVNAFARSNDWPPTPPYLTMERVDGHFTPKVKNPWSISRYLKRLIDDFTKDNNVDFRDRWYGIDPDIRKPVEDALGPMPEATLDDVPLAEAIDYANRDSDATNRNWPALKSMVDQMGLNQILAIDMGAIPMFERMQHNGLTADVPYLRALGQRMTERMADIQQQVKVMTGAEINPNSPDQTRELLFDQLGLTPGKLTKGGKDGRNKKPSTNDKILEAMRFVHPVVGLICDYRECSKIKSSFCDPVERTVQGDMRVRGTIKVTRVESGRCSMADPNMTAQPVRSDLGKELRNGYIAAPGKVLGTWDLDQIELREMAHQSRDPLLMELLTREDRDVHSETAALSFGLKLYDSRDKKERYQNVHPIRHRYAAKRIGFGVITGITGLGLKAQMDLANATKNGLPIGQGGDAWSESDCDGLILEYFNIYRAVRRYMLSCRAECRQTGMVRDRWGRIRYLPGIYSQQSWVREEAERQSHSHKISSSAQGVLKQAMAAIWDVNVDMLKQGRYVEPILQIHDELIYEVEDDPDLKSYWDSVMVGCLCHTTVMAVPIRSKGGYGHRWGDLEK